MKPSIIERFEDKIFYSPDGCWYWTAYQTADSTNPHGNYGVFGLNGKSILAHRMSYLLYKGEIPKGKLVCHSCDNSICVNPYHLWLGTSQDNMNDMVKKRRSSYGELRHNSKLKSIDILRIRQLHPEINQSEIARQYGVTPSIINLIVNRKIWKHI